jgi:hypothetical protein
VAIGNANTLLALVVPRERRIRVLATLEELHEKGRINYLHVENICNIRLMSNLDRSAHGKGQSCYNKIRLIQAPCAGLLNISLALFDLRKLKYSELDSGTLTEHSCIVCLQSHFSMHPIPLGVIRLGQCFRCSRPPSRCSVLYHTNNNLEEVS